MTHARKKGSLGQYHGEGWGHIESWLHEETLGGVLPVRSLQEGKTKKDMAKKVKTTSHVPKRSMKMGKTKKDLSKREQRSERKRKLYPLRRRGGASEKKALSCHVLLTRLDDWEEDNKKSKADRSRVSGHKSKSKSNNKAENKRETTKIMKEATIYKPLTQEPRKRRLASLNAEAVNSLLLEKADGPPGAKLAKKQGYGTTSAEQTKTCPNPKRASQASKSETCQNPKQMKKDKVEEKDKSEVGLYAPTPRRLAGLNAAAFLKLTSSTTGNKLRIKTDNKSLCASGKHAVRCKPKAQKSKKQICKQPVLKDFELKLKDEGSPESHRLTKPGYQSCNMLGYPVKVVKEEQVEADLSPYYCCPPEGSVEYCHRLALFLEQKAYGETEEHPVTSVKHECLVPPPSLAHPALTLSAHPCLCADPCHSSYYVHIAHARPPGASLSTQPLPCAHSPFCPHGVSGSKLLAPSGIPHHAFCNSVGSPCYREACTVNRYAFSAMQPVTSRACPFSTNCSNCSHPIKTGYSSSQEEHSCTLLVPPALPLSRCPSVPRVNPSSPAVPRLLNTLSDRRQAEVHLKVAKECPQNTKPPNGSLAIGHTRLSQRPPTTGPASAKHQKKGDDEMVLRQCYEGVERDGEVIRVRDTVLLRSGLRKKSLPYVAKISALWEDPRSGELMMSLFWYYQPEHTQGGRDPSMHCENEIFASRHQDENSVACIEDRCYVLPLAQYCRFCALVKRRSEGVCDSTPVVPGPSDSAIPPHRLVPDDVDPELVYLCRHVYDFRYGRILKNLQ
ncbi:bromo adjacent homology domain-containing 1 protein-like isoform X2 [Myxocyprinus asiaticus]|uniref:bromo adjacent homology domain-containing 1 protein-like isoform X2 n=1 Tax=Myxocyprinus asiaticus TaxID=70543 RepID=UPI002222BC0B|nr:bromo adjacent homology domain-containing 1 protein-like isoform X2 [Myxocyprinus asiaticus]